jgi:predicted  nucleic acid-binding Zn-ribbon protein
MHNFKFCPQCGENLFLYKKIDDPNFDPNEPILEVQYWKNQKKRIDPKTFIQLDSKKMIDELIEISFQLRSGNNENFNKGLFHLNDLIEKLKSIGG